MIDLLISPLEPERAGQIAAWHYDPPYQVYDLARGDLELLLDPVYRYHQVLDRSGGLVGYCCYGKDAQVPGGDYSRGEPEVLDVGVGLRPELVGQGRGRDFVGAILAYGGDKFHPEYFRATVADFNLRSMNTFRGLGFEVSYHLKRVPDGMPFTQLEVKTHDVLGQ
jgi:ribosomal-protein-alanine N-acetyltransferase